MSTTEEVAPFPLLALVGQAELKMALILALINPMIGGVLLAGPYGVGKTTAVRGLLDLLPLVERDELDEHGQAQRHVERMRLVELPLNARLEDVVGGINERIALEQQRVSLEAGILARAHGHLLYVDEINLLDPQVADAILDAAAQGRTMVRRGPMVRLFPSRFVLIGSMNPEEGSLRPQITDRFGLRVWVDPLSENSDRLEVYRRAGIFRRDPQALRTAYAAQTAALAEEIVTAREILPYVEVPAALEARAIELVQALQIPSHRAEIALLEAARAHAAADYRNHVNDGDLLAIAPLALRQRQSPVIAAYHQEVQRERQAIVDALATLNPLPPAPPEPPAPRKRRSTVAQLRENQPDE